jgi:hypothetical protein
MFVPESDVVGESSCVEDDHPPVGTFWLRRKPVEDEGSSDVEVQLFAQLARRCAAAIHRAAGYLPIRLIRGLHEQDAIVKITE